MIGTTESPYHMLMPDTLLDDDEQRALIALLDSDDVSIERKEEATYKLVRNYFPMILFAIAKKKSNCSPEHLSDLISEGIMGIYEGINYFLSLDRDTVPSPSKSIYSTIRNHISQANHSAHSIKYPNLFWHYKALIDHLITHISVLLNHPISVEDIMEYLDIPDRYKKMYTSYKTSIVPLDKVINAQGGTIADTLISDDHIRMDEKILSEEFMDAVRATLDDDELYYIVAHKMGIGNHIPMSTTQIAHLKRRSDEWVRNKMRTAIRILQERLNIEDWI